MPVVIHDFEVIPEQPAAPPGRSDAPAPAAAAAQAEPEQLLAEAQAREQRVREY